MDTLKLICAVLLLHLLPLSAYATSISIVPETTSRVEQNQIHTAVQLVSDAPSFNVIDGSITLPETVKFVRLIQDGAIELWLSPPAYDPQTRTISFIGGSRTPFPNNTRLFTLILSGDIEAFTVRTTGTGYVGDGTGTAVQLETQSQEVLTTVDTGARERVPISTITPLSVQIAQDTGVYEGRWYVVFYGGDMGTGVVRYHIAEQGFPLAESDGIYVLQNQSPGAQFTVTAVQSDGSLEAVSGSIPERTLPWFAILIGALSLVTVLILLMFRRS